MTETDGVAVILAAGEGKRMKSDLPKVLHEAAGEPLLAHVGRAARESGAARIIVVIGNGADLVRDAFREEGWEFVVQTERLGTADAVRRAAPLLGEADGDVLVLAGDTPLLRGSTLATLLARHQESGAAVTVLTARLADPFGYGRIVRNDDGDFIGIVEEKDATVDQRAIDEVNSGVYCFCREDLLSALARIGANNAQGEYYLTDAVGILRRAGKKAVAVAAAQPEEILGVNNPDQLREACEILEREGS